MDTTDLQRLQSTLLRLDSELIKSGDHSAGDDLAETARILSVLLRVREGCRIRFAAADTDSAGCTIPAELEFTGPADTLRDLAELLGGGK